MEKDPALYSQHIKGKHNFISDSLSRDTHIQTQHLTHSFKTILPTQIHKNFKISPLPVATDSWIRSTLRSSTKTQESPEPPNRSKLGALTDGNVTSKEWESTMNGLENTLQNREHTCCPRLRAAADEINMVRHARQYSPAEQSKPPSRMYARPFGRIFGQTQR